VAAKPKPEKTEDKKPEKAEDKKSEKSEDGPKTHAKTQLVSEIPGYPQIPGFPQPQIPNPYSAIPQPNGLPSPQAAISQFEQMLQQAEQTMGISPSGPFAQVLNSMLTSSQSLASQLPGMIPGMPSPQMPGMPSLPQMPGMPTPQIPGIPSPPQLPTI